MSTQLVLANYIQHVSKNCSSRFSPLQQQKDKLLEELAYIVRTMNRKELQKYDPSLIVPCTIRMLFYYKQDITTKVNVCDWKRKRKFRLVRFCYYSLLKTYIPEKVEELIQAIVEIMYKDKLWEFQDFCINIINDLLKYGVSCAIIVHTMWDKIERIDINSFNIRATIRTFYKILDTHKWPETRESVIMIERILKLYYTNVVKRTSFKSDIPIILKRGLEVCLRNTVKHLCNNHLLVVVYRMCSWATEEIITDESVLEFGSILEYTAFLHKTELYENTLTPMIFPLLMQMVASHSKIISLLGNRVIQYLIDRNANRFKFDTPRLFFENVDFDIKMGIYQREDKLFLKIHREALHENLLRSIMRHRTSRMNLETTYSTISLIAVEVPCGFTAAALVCLAMNLQDLILSQNDHNSPSNYHIHAVVISIMSLLCWIHKADVFYGYVNKIMTERARWAPHLNPPIQSQYNFAIHHIFWNKPELFFIDWEIRYGLWSCFRLHNQHDIISIH